MFSVINDIDRSFHMPLNRYCVRSMNETDLDIVLAIERETWGNESWSSNDFLRALENPLDSCWILESITTDYKVLGYGIQSSIDNTSCITNICLHPYQRGRGLGGILLRHMIDYARKTNASMVELDVHTSNTRAYNLYVQHGFEIIAYQYRYYSDSSHAFKMRLLL